MPRYEITQSLISAWNYVHDCWEGCEEDAMQSFLTALRGEKEELTPEQLQNIQNGFDFEKLVTDIATGKFHPQREWATDKDGNLSIEPNSGEPMCKETYPKWYRPAAEFGAMLKGAQFQVRIHRPITVRGMEFEIHGVLDALKEGVIYDIKFKNKSFGSSDIAGDWLNSPQHPFYFYLVPEARKFMYLVSDGNDIYIEQYFPEETVPAAKIIAEFVDFLEASGLMEVYREHWQLR